MVSDDKQIYKCFGCGNGGNVITFAMEYDRLDFKDALKELAEYAAIDMTQYDFKITSKDIEAKDEKEKLKQTNKIINSYFVNCLASSAMAKTYLHDKRKLTDEVIARFGL
jgi:DNA primase